MDENIMNNDIASLDARSMETIAGGLVPSLQGVAPNEEPESSAAGEATDKICTNA